VWFLAECERDDAQCSTNDPIVVLAMMVRLKGPSPCIKSLLESGGVVVKRCVMLI